MIASTIPLIMRRKDKNRLVIIGLKKVEIVKKIEIKIN
tara:strand:+ start:1653 stop:1766 length:114 start_codon:yes stop_codon:yes gene_type:complete